MEKGRDVLIVYDESHPPPRTYRRSPFCCERIPGDVKLIPGDIFYLHSRLLERLTTFSTAPGGDLLLRCHQSKPSKEYLSLRPNQS